ncbi:hypothetical protein DU500_02240 [Haloplanus rubicundus]|uniref:Uncharacterized protein n=1 Tax=Haloplanus rubicundus TaxID=1547898 RepID=A0A345DZG9_9EURY|nr:hypothetical protein [Haloplanus rubicundus]AXG05341.1 hypothetical protein DU500_02240 [Haloplanus rubicundus]AXG08697.1 hypothetical protein DU484_01830 [Haloplanus rubicundus]
MVASILLTATVPAAIWALSYPFVAAVAVATLVAVAVVVGAVVVRVGGPSVTRRVAAAVGRLGRP